jgi:hypothetical protein
VAEIYATRFVEMERGFEEKGIRMKNLPSVLNDLKIFCLHGSANILTPSEDPPAPAGPLRLLIGISEQLRIAKNNLSDYAQTETDVKQKKRFSEGFSVAKSLFDQALSALHEVATNSCNFHAREVTAFYYYYLSAKEIEFSLKSLKLTG